MARLWQASNAGGGLDPEVDAFLSSLAVDSRLLPEDLECSAAHARMLGATGILPAVEAARIAAELDRMRAEAAAGTLRVSADSEDVHSFIEAELTRRLGDTGKAVHAGRSRNDQVAVAFRLYLKRAFAGTQARMLDAIEAILDLAEDHTRTLMPGYTHLQRAQPVTLAHHLLAWCAALERDHGRLADAARRADECPLGSGALAGSGLPVDREATAAALGFARPTRNSMDSVADRDAAVDYTACAAQIMTHLSRACEDIALWASAEYAFVKVSDRASTGSSIMPQKRNPDPAELIRGKAARVYGDLQALLVMQKGLAYAYNRDLQEDKEILFDAQAAADGSLGAFAVLVSSLVPDTARMRASLDSGFVEATDVAEYLVKAGIPFRTAYVAAKEMVLSCVKSGRRPAELAPAEILALHPAFSLPGFNAASLAAYLDIEACVERRSQTGGPASARTTEEIARLRTFVGASR